MADPVGQVQGAATVWLILAAVLGFILYITSIYQRKKKRGQLEDGQNTVRARPVPVARNEGPGGVRVARSGRQRMHAQRQRQPEEESEDSNDEESTKLIATKEDGGKVGAKKLRKLQEKAEKKAQREQMEQEREERKKQEKLREEERKKEEEEERKEQERLAEEERQRKEEQERLEHEEYLKLKDMFVVEEEGEMSGETEEESQLRLREFLEFIKNTKVVMLEDLASEFSLRVQEAIERIESLQEMGMLTGVMDDRGKFIYISEDELINVAKFIKRRGRVAISELAECSNKLIGMKGNLATFKEETTPVEASA